MQMQKEWLKNWPWETVVTINAGLCEEKGLCYQPNAGYDATRKLWEDSRSQKLSLAEALGICRNSHLLSPFAYFNGNTFVAIGRTLVQDTIVRLPPDRAHIFRSVIGHYIAGTAGQEELQSALADWNN